MRCIEINVEISNRKELGKAVHFIDRPYISVGANLEIQGEIIDKNTTSKVVLFENTLRERAILYLLTSNMNFIALRGGKKICQEPQMQ